MKYVVTSKGPIDRHEPGTDVSSVYPADVLQRLISEGYVEAFEKVTPKRKQQKMEAADGRS